MTRILLIEDDFLIRLFVEEMIVDLGYELVTSASSVAEGLAAVDDAEFDLALLDADLAGKDSLPVAEALWKKNIPYVLATGASAQGLASFAHCSGVLSKPFDMKALSEVLSSLTIDRPEPCP